MFSLSVKEAKRKKYVTCRIWFVFLTLHTAGVDSFTIQACTVKFAIVDPSRTSNRCRKTPHRTLLRANGAGKHVSTAASRLFRWVDYSEFQSSWMLKASSCLAGSPQPAVQMWKKFRRTLWLFRRVVGC